jgi:hypothetical protein
MRRYWIKIVAGALAIFLVGYAVYAGMRSQVNRFRHMKASDGPIDIPLAFVPFSMEGTRLGTFRRVRIMRDAPNSVSGVYLRVRLSETAPVESLEACGRMAVTDQTTDFDVSRLNFTCLDSTASDSGLIEFGEIEFDPEHGARFTVPLLLTEVTVKEMRSSHPGDVAAKSAAGEHEAVRVEAESLRVHAESVAAEVKRNAIPPRPPQP